jgi:hypothetical protein
MDSFRTDSKAISDAVIATFTVVLAVATIQLARATNLLAKDTRQNSRQREIEIAITSAQAILAELTKASDMIEHSGDIAPDAYEPLNTADELALACKARYHNVRLLRDFAGISISRQYAHIQPSMLRLREIAGEADMFAGLEWLAANMPAVRKGKVSSVGVAHKS